VMKRMDLFFSSLDVVLSSAVQRQKRLD